MLIYTYSPYSVSGRSPQGKANIYDDLLDTLKLLEEDPEPLRQSEKVCSSYVVNLIEYTVNKILELMRMYCGVSFSACCVVLAYVKLACSHYNGVVRVTCLPPTCTNWIKHLLSMALLGTLLLYVLLHTHTHNINDIIYILRDPANESMTSKGNPVGLNETKMQ